MKRQCPTPRNIVRLNVGVLIKNTNLKICCATHPSAAKDTKIEALERAAATALEKAKMLCLRGADVSLEELRCKYLCPL